ncbi:MAG: hypothetical protein LV480_15085 [Methylacidiphilales bacterium]|nr:hypothetical protein [Candidatus Methylacidiphilales bacterium]
MIRLPRLCLATALVFAASAASVLLAQQPAQETLQQRLTAPAASNNPPGVPLGTANSDLGEIGVVPTYTKPETITLSTSQQFFYTTNVFYTNANTISSLAYLGNYTLSYVPYSLQVWTPRITAQYNMVRYGNAAEADFNNENLSLSSEYVFSDDHKWSWTADINLGRYTDAHADGNEFYEEVVYDNQINWTQQLVKSTPLYLIAGYDIAYHQANPALFDRLDNTLSLSFSYNPIPQITIATYVRPGVRNYFVNGGPVVNNGVFSTTSNQNNRVDFNLSEGLDVTWQPCKYVSISADLSHTNDYSNNGGLSYNDTIPGLSLTGTLKFW